MIIHLGGEVTVLMKDIVAILKWKKEDRTEITNTFFHRAFANGEVVLIDEASAQSCVITSDRVYLSPISPATLKKRAELLQDLNLMESS